MHVDPNWVIAVMTAFTAVLVPILVMIYRGTVKWTRVEDKLDNMVSKMTDLVADKDKTHAEIIGQMNARQAAEDKVHAELMSTMRQDRDTADRRLRYIEEFWMSQGRNAIMGKREDYEFHGTGSAGSITR